MTRRWGGTINFSPTLLEFRGGYCMSGSVIGFVGIGRMGGLMAKRLLAAGYKLCIFDTNPAVVAELQHVGVVVADSAQQVGNQAETVLISLPTPDIVNDVVLGGNGIAHGSRVKSIIDLSTTGPGTAGRVSAALKDRNITWLDAPVSGGLAGARDGKLAVMVSGPKPSFAAQEALLANFGKLFFIGEKAGLAQVAKLANNLLAASAMVVSSEAVVMGVKAGIDPKILIDIINVSSGRNSATQDKFPRSVLTRSFDFGFATGLSYKDVRLCIDEAEAIGVPMVAGAAVRQMLAVTNAKFGPDSDFTSITRVVEEWAGVEVKG
jgi:3-hydroxyisobutyrate dehydrogenase-like beta-hydroxyacid dehydrogenase